MRARHGLLTILLVAFLAPTLCAQGLPTADPGDVGLSDERLERLERVMQEYVDEDQIAGAVSLIARRGRQAHLEAYGVADVETQRQMETDAIFRIASMSKPITSVAVMMLYEEGHFRLNDPVGRYIPALADLDVLEVTDSVSGSYRRVPARRPVTIRHLLTHTSGITYRFMGDFGGSYKQRLLSKLYGEAGVTDGLVEHDGDLAGLVEKLGELPLLHQPGEGYSYGLSVDVLGHLVEVVSGMSFDEFLRTRLFEPLGMEDTHFFLPAEKSRRLASVHAPEGEGGIEKVDGRVEGEHLVYSSTYTTGEHRTHFSGGAGLSSTARDYARFAQMLLNGGELDGVRILSPVTVDFMTSDHIGDIRSGPVSPGSGGFGLGFGIDGPPNRVGELGSEGAFRWGGFFNTTFWVDRANELVAILMTQIYPNTTDIQDKFRIMTYQSIVER